MNPTAIPIKDLAFAARLRELMNRDGLNQAAAANACGVTVTALQNYLKGRLPQPGQAKSIAKGFRVSLSWLLDGEGESVSNIQQPLMPPSRLRRVWEALGGVSAERLSALIDVPPQRAQQLLLGQVQPNVAELVNLLDEVTNVALVLANYHPALSHDHRLQANDD